MTTDPKENQSAGRGGVWLGDERRKWVRAEVDEAAYVSSGGASTRCRARNISMDGAAIDVPNAAFIPQRFQLMTEKDRLIRKCRVVWMQRNRIGVAFETETES
jgi:PilZ domain